MFSNPIHSQGSQNCIPCRWYVHRELAFWVASVWYLNSMSFVIGLELINVTKMSTCEFLCCNNFKQFQTAIFLVFRIQLVLTDSSGSNHSKLYDCPIQHSFEPFDFCKVSGSNCCMIFMKLTSERGSILKFMWNRSIIKQNIGLLPYCWNYKILDIREKMLCSKNWRK